MFQFTLCTSSWRTFRIFFIFSSVLGAGKGEESEAERGGYFLFKNGEGGRVSEEGRWGGSRRGWEGVAGRGGGAKFFFFFGAEMSTKSWFTQGKTKGQQLKGKIVS